MPIRGTACRSLYARGVSRGVTVGLGGTTCSDLEIVTNLNIMKWSRIKGVKCNILTLLVYYLQAALYISMV